MKYFASQYYSATQARFVSPDEYAGGADEVFVLAASNDPTFYADLNNPQTLNKYQYCFHNPLRYVDPDGHDPITANSPLGRFVQGSVIAAGGTLANDGAVRTNYTKAAASAASKAERKVMQQEARRQLSRFGQEVSKLADKSRVGQEVRHTAQSASRTNPGWNKIGTASQVAGRSLVVASVVFSVATIATAPEGQRAETAAVEVGAWGGALMGAPIGAKVGAGLGSLAPGPGTAIGAGVGTLVGGGVGAMAGSTATRELIKHPPPFSMTTVKVSPLIPIQ